MKWKWVNEKTKIKDLNILTIEKRKNINNKFNLII